MCVGHATERQQEPGTQRDIPATWTREAAVASSVTGRGTDTTRKRRVVTAEGERWNGKLCKCDLEAALCVRVVWECPVSEPLALPHHPQPEGG